MEQLGAIAEEEQKITDAMIYYEKAADYHEADTHGKSSLNTCLIKVGNLAAQCSEYSKAIGCFDKAANNYISNDVMRFKVKPLWVDSGICRLGNDDVVSLKKALGTYSSSQPDFVKTREFAFLDSLVEAITERDGDKLSAAVTEYDSFTRLQRWQTAILLRIKDSLEDPQDNFG